jgi:hypothetical protein
MSTIELKFVQHRTHTTLWWVLEALTRLLEDTDNLSPRSRRAIRDMVREPLDAWTSLDIQRRVDINKVLRLAIEQWVRGSDGVLAYDLAKRLLEELGAPD